MAIFQACTLLGHVGIFTYDLDAYEYATMKGFTWRVIRLTPTGKPLRVLEGGVMPLYQPDNHDRYGLFISVHDIGCPSRPIGHWDMIFVHNFREGMDMLYENADKIFVDIPDRVKSINIKDSSFCYGHVNGIPALLIPEDIGDTEARNIFRRYGLYATRVYERGGELNSGVAFAVTESPLGKDNTFNIVVNPKGGKSSIFEMFVWGRHTHDCVSECIDAINWDEYHLSDGEHFIVTKDRLPYSFDGKYSFLGKEVYRYDAIYNPDEDSQIIDIEDCDQKRPTSDPCGTILSLKPLEGLEFVSKHEPLRRTISISTFMSNPALLDVEEQEYHRMRVCGIDCLVTEDILPDTDNGQLPISRTLKRFSDEKEIKYLYRYNIRKSDNDGEIGEITKSVVVNHGGTILSMEPILGEEEDDKLIDSMYDVLCSYVSIREYVVSKPE